ncbi:hypothetical protein C0989_006653 [Termitomyces sp. Mn162]|nr:hypothetical protein C0989_006653 [Termitomyces sp. Mn162]
MSSSSISSSSFKADPALPPSPSSLSASSISSHYPSDQEDEDNVTVTRSLMKKDGKQRSQEDLRLLAVSTLMTELSYSISDIQTQIQELRHKSHSSTDTTSTTNVIDQSLMNLDEKLESVEKGMKSINDSLDPLLQTTSTPILQSNGDPSYSTLLLRKHTTLQAEWETVRTESDVLREELKEDKWLTVFRTVTDQADGMMSSLEKAVNRCQDFIWQVHRRGVDDTHQSQTLLSGKRNDNHSALTLEVFAPLSESFEAKKRHYMPATSKVLAIIDKGVRDRVTKNGETLRRHAESAQRWKNLRERIARTDVEMESVRQLLVNGEATPSEIGSSTSTKDGYLATPSSGSRASSSASTLSSSISPLRKFARKITGTKRPPVTPLSINKDHVKRAPTSEPVPSFRQQKTSFFSSMRGSQPVTPITSDKPGHRHSQSLTPDTPHAIKADSSAVKSRVTPPVKQRWNGSTKVEPESAPKGTPPKRPPSATGTYAYKGDIPPVPPLGTVYRRSISRASMVSSRPWSPVTSTSTTQSSQPTHFPIFRPPSRAQTPAGRRGVTPGLGTTPRRRPKTPSHIPLPPKRLHITPSRSENSEDDDNPDLQRALSPTMSVTSSGFMSHPPRPPSRSMIPVPSLHFSTPSRPSSSMSSRGSVARAQTPESTLRANVQRIVLFPGMSGRVTRPTGVTKLPPSSFKDSTGSLAPSRPGSRIGVTIPNLEKFTMHGYIPSNPKDPLDAEVATIVNSTMHSLFIERLDPPLKTIPKPGEEVKARYAFTNTLSRKELTLRLTTLTRPGKGTEDVMSTKRVMCRVGGDQGWQDLSDYILSRQAGT